MMKPQHPSPQTNKAKQPSKVQRKQVNATAKGHQRRVRFAETEPDIRYFVPDNYWDDDQQGQGDEDDDIGAYDYDNGMTDDGRYYQGPTIYRPTENDTNDDDDDDDTVQSDAYEQYDEDDYDLRHYPDHHHHHHQQQPAYYNRRSDDYHPPSHYPRHPAASTHYTHYDDDNEHEGLDHRYYDDNEDERDYWDEQQPDDEDEIIRRPWSTGRYMEYERPAMYYSPQRHHSARIANREGAPPRRPTANPRMWQPSRMVSQQQQWHPTVTRSSSASHRYRPPLNG
jgi:hypothetical protein